MGSTQRNFILHIEDDEDDRSMFNEAVNQLAPCLEVWASKNGQEGLETLLQCTLLQHLPVLIVLDLNLPGMDGKKVLMELKNNALLAAIPVVIFTTSSSELDRMFALRHKVNFFTKPSYEAEFMQTVKNFLEAVCPVKCF